MNVLTSEKENPEDSSKSLPIFFISIPLIIWKGKIKF